MVVDRGGCPYGGGEGAGGQRVEALVAEVEEEAVAVGVGVGWRDGGRC